MVVVVVVIVVGVYKYTRRITKPNSQKRQAFGKQMSLVRFTRKLFDVDNNKIDETLITTAKITPSLQMTDLYAVACSKGTAASITYKQMVIK